MNELNIAMVVPQPHPYMGALGAIHRSVDSPRPNRDIVVKKHHCHCLIDVFWLPSERSFAADILTYTLDRLCLRLLLQSDCSPSLLTGEPKYQLRRCWAATVIDIAEERNGADIEDLVLKIEQADLDP